MLGNQKITKEDHNRWKEQKELTKAILASLPDNLGDVLRPSRGLWLRRADLNRVREVLKRNEELNKQQGVNHA